MMAETIDSDSSRETQSAMMLAALGNEVRLRIYRLLLRAGHDGLSVGMVQERLGIPPSTLSHHIATMRQAGLVGQRRDGRTIINSANYENMDALIGYLTDECCLDATRGDGQ